MQTVKNITDIKYFLERFDTIDPGYNYQVDYHADAERSFTSLPTFVAEFMNCSVNSCPVLVTEDKHLITNHVWNLTHKSRNKPQKSHGLWASWGDTIDLEMPTVTKQFNEEHKYVWLPIDEDSTANPWHILIDVISKFRLVEKRWSTAFTEYVFILANPSTYFDKIAKELFPELKYYVMPKGETWRFQHLIVPSLSNHHDGVITPHLAPWLRHFKGRYGIVESKIPNRKIYVSRQGSLTRSVSNHDELLLALRGWESVRLETMAVSEQIKIFSEASHVLAPHGAGLINLIWCKEGTKVTEIQDIKMVKKKVYPVLSHTLKLDHNLYIAPTLPVTHKGKTKPKGIKRFNDLITFEINIPNLMACID
tara:strand:+ start:15 stop:1109 length:1095 start_codon:yes stop_codon:yes gene_type:complete